MGGSFASLTTVSAPTEGLTLLNDPRPLLVAKDQHQITLKKGWINTDIMQMTGFTVTVDLVHLSSPTDGFCPCQGEHL